MKKLMLSILSLAFFAGIGHTQRVENNPGETPEIRKQGKLMLISKMDNRKIYNWANGQRSTPTGRQAEKENAIYARVYGDSAVVVRRNSKK